MQLSHQTGYIYWTLNIKGFSKEIVKKRTVCCAVLPGIASHSADDLDEKLEV